MKSILFLSTILTLVFGSTLPASAGPLGTYKITITGTSIESGESHAVRANGNMKLTSLKGRVSVMNLSGNRGRSLLRFSKPINRTAKTQRIKGTVEDLNFDGKGTFTGKLIRRGTRYTLTASVRISYPDGVMKGTLSGTK